MTMKRAAAIAELTMVAGRLSTGVVQSDSAGSELFE
jgi:hypothetical protein